MSEPSDPALIKYKRVLLKLSGEALQGSHRFNIDPDVVLSISKEIKEVLEHPVQLALNIGGGNIFRGTSAEQHGMDRVTADYMGMLATVINSLAMQSQLEALGVQTRVLSALTIQEVAEPYIKRRATRHLEKGRVVIFAAGTGNPYFSSDTSAALRAIEIGADIILKATKVDGIYDKDPVKYPDATRIDEITYMDVIKKGLRVMDQTAISLCMENGLPIRIFDMTKPNNIKRALLGEKLGSIVVKK